MSEKKEFDLAALLKDVSESNTGREQIEYIRRDLIDDDPNNFYQLSDLEKLADNIAMCGLQQPIRVRKHPSAEGRYMIVSGHRRRAAVNLLAQDDPERWEEIPCIIEQEATSPSLQQLRLIYANSNTRALTSAELSEQAVQVEKLLYQLKEEGYEFPGRMRDHVAKAVNASTTKLAKLKVIREKLAFCWKPAFQDSLLGESVAYALAQMPSRWQELIYDNYGTKPKQLYEGTVKECARRFEEIDKMACGDKGDVVCTHKLEMMKKSCKDQWSDPCWSNYCCMKCNSLQTCRSACSHASAKKKELQATAKEANRRAEEDRIKREQPIIDFIREVYNRVGIAREAGCVSVEDLYKAERMVYSAVADDPKQEALEDGSAKFSINTTLPFGYSSYASSFMIACNVADALNCSVDFLLGRSEDLRPAGKWQTGKPEGYGTYVAYVKITGVAKHLLRELLWDGDEWFINGEKISDVGVTVKYWTEQPEDLYGSR